jgi:hypothetical protein
VNCLALFGLRASMMEATTNIPGFPGLSAHAEWISLIGREFRTRPAKISAYGI